ncbi:MAG: CHAT domain-containing protein [Aulosira sp. DedQUE10]|nr:CHAT domain-containing protein [Aulosira sp. DedQUE10]
MKKLVILKFYGNFESGFQVNLEIANEGQPAYRTTTAKLPENINIPQLLNNWHEIYCSQYSQFRVKSGGSRRVNLESLKQECTRESINLLASFNKWLIVPSFTSIVNFLQELNPKDEIRIIITTSCHELRQLPWHLWDVLINFPLVEVALSSPNAEQGERAYREKIRILIILGDSSKIDIETDKKLLHNFCGDDAEIVLLQQPLRADLNHYLQDDLGWDILFFSGHSQTEKTQGTIYINHHDSLTIAELRDALQVAIQRRLQIAFFNSCDGLGIAYELEQLHIPQVIVMRQPVPDKVAQEFLKYFLQEFTGGKSLYISVRNARFELQQLESEFPCASWLPIIIQNQTETPPTWQSLGIISFCPYQGLSAFKEENAKYLFGRNKATASLVTAVNSKPLVAVIGASGSGKSSLVFAGLIPQLRGDTINNWLILSFRPGKNPFAALAVALVSALNLPDNERRLAELELDVNLQRDSTSLERFITSPLTHLLGGEGKRILLIADQFEEIYTLCTDAEERKIFLDGLLQAVNNAPFFTLLLTLRADFLSRALDDYEPFAQALQQYQLEPVVRMNREELEAAIALPARQLGFEFEKGLCNTIIDDIEDGDGRLPLLEFTLTQLWKQQYAGKLTHQAYKKIGGVEQALANYADMVYADLSEGERKTAQRVFIQLVQPGEGTEDTRKLATSEEVGDYWDLVTRLADKRLVVTNWDELRNEETVEVVHEALIRHWGRLRGWMQENRKFRIWQQGLIVALQQWVESGKDEGALLRGATLAVAEDWLQQRGGEVSKAQRRFIEKGVELRERERLERLQRRQRTILVLVVFLVIALILAGVAGLGWWSAQLKQIDVISKSSESLLIGNQKLEALLESLKAQKKLQTTFLVNQDIQTKVTIAMLQAVYGVEEFNRVEGHSDGIISVSFSPDGKIIASASLDKTIKLWNTNGSLIRTFKGHKDFVIDVAFSPDGQTIASASFDKTIKIWRLDGTLIKTFKYDSQVYRVNFSPDGKILAAALDDGTAQLWHINDERLITTLKKHGDTDAPSKFVTRVSFSPDGQTLASASADNTVKIWRLDGKLISSFKGHNNWVMDVSFSPDGKIVASSSTDGTIKLWNLKGALLDTLEGHSGGVYRVIFSSDGERIASASHDGTLILWKVSIFRPSDIFSDGSSELVARGRPFKIYKGHKQPVSSVSFSPDGKTIASASLDQTIRLWSLNSTTDAIEPTKDILSIDNRTIITVSEDGIYFLLNWNGELVKKLQCHSQEKEHNYIQLESTELIYCPQTKVNNLPIDKAINVQLKDYDITVKVWSTDNKLLHSFKIKKSDYIELSYDNNMVASYSYENSTIKISSIEGKLISIFQHNFKDKIEKGSEIYSPYITNINFSPDNKIIISSGNDGSINLWHINSIKPISLEGHNRSVNNVSFSPDSQIIASSSDDNTVKLWKRDGTWIKTLYHEKGVKYVKFSPDGKMIASATGTDEDLTIKLWNREGNLLTTLIPNEMYPESVSFSSDGQMLAAHSGAKVILWELNLNKLMKRGCNWLHDYLQNNPNVSPEDKHLCDNIKR